MAKKKDTSKAGGEGKHSPTIENRRARHDFAIIDTVEAGMILRGSEVKSIRDGKVSLGEGFVRVEFGALTGAVKVQDVADVAKSAKAKPAAPGATTAKAKPKIVRRRMEPGLYLHGVNIAEYAPAGPSGSVGQHKPTRVRTLLVHTRELARMAKEVQTKGATLVPLKIYFKNGKAKLLVGIGKSKTFADKRDSIAKRDAQRDIARAMSRKV